MKTKRTKLKQFLEKNGEFIHSVFTTIRIFSMGTYQTILLLRISSGTLYILSGDEIIGKVFFSTDFNIPFLFCNIGTATQ